MGPAARVAAMAGRTGAAMDRIDGRAVPPPVTVARCAACRWPASCAAWLADGGGAEPPAWCLNRDRLRGAPGP